MELEPYFVGVKSEYLISNPPPIANSYPDQLNTSNGSKKRRRDDKISPEERICQQTIQGNICPFGNSCKYSHDIIKYLESKPSDIGPRCHEYDTYGYCHTGFMCRYGDCHIDRINGINLRRPESEGGVIERPSINVLSKELQVRLRKKNYQPPSNSNSNEMKVQGEDNEEKDEEKQVEENKEESKESISKTINEESYNSTPYAHNSGTIKLVDFSNKVYIAPLTTIGNLPFRRILKEFGADITCGEMAMVNNINSGQSSEWALLKRHPSETIFGIQVASTQSNELAFCAKILENETQSDFIDFNCGCPIDAICNKGAGAALLNRPKRLYDAVRVLTKHLTRSITVKVRTGWDDKNPNGHKVIPELQKISRGKIAAVMMHGRSRLQRYTGAANWEYILTAARSQDTSLPLLQIIGNGDIFSYQDWKSHQNLMAANLSGEEIGLCNCAMLGRGAIIKPWLPTEIKEERQWDISASERLDMYRRFVWYGLEHWGSDQQGINTTRRFLLEWLSFTHRYVPAGIIEHTRQPQTIFQKPPCYRGRCDLETLLSSPNCTDWVEISKMLLGPLPDGFEFVPKHKSNSYPVTSTSSSSSTSTSTLSNSNNSTTVDSATNESLINGGIEGNVVSNVHDEWNGDVE